MKRKHDSSLTRVAPAFQVVGNSADNINAFFGLFNARKSVPLLEHGDCYQVLYGKHEKVLSPSPHRLRWLVEHPDELTIPGKPTCKKETFDLRKAFLEGKPNKDVQQALQSGKFPRWLRFEGPTHPDIFIETEKYIAVGEGKRTERQLTTSTTWCKERDQLIRHIDAILDKRNGKPVFSFLIVENPDLYDDDLCRFRSPDFFNHNLRHRSNEDVRLAFESYLGVLTWSCLKRKFPGIAYRDELT